MMKRVLLAAAVMAGAGPLYAVSASDLSVEKRAELLKLKLGPMDAAYVRKLKQVEKEMQSNAKTRKDLSERFKRVTDDMQRNSREFRDLMARHAAIWCEIVLDHWLSSAKDGGLRKIEWKVGTVPPKGEDAEIKVDMITVVLDVYGAGDVAKKDDPEKFVRDLATQALAELKQAAAGFDVGIAVVTVGAKDRDVKKNVEWGVLAFDWAKKEAKFLKLAGLERLEPKKTAWPKAKPWWE